jgi:hypothetical protein
MLQMHQFGNFSLVICLLQTLAMAQLGAACMNSQSTSSSSSSSNAPQDFVSARDALAAAQRAADRPNTEAPGLPVALKTADGVGVLVFFLGNSGPANPHIAPPEYAVELDRLGKIVKSAAIEPGRIAAFSRRSAEPGIGTAATLAVPEYIAKRRRFLDVSPLVWAAFARSANADEPGTKELVSEYWALFCSVTRGDDGPYYLEASPAFFDWVRKLAK